MWHRVFFVAVFYLAAEVNCETRVAIANLISENVTGSITFTETENGLRVSGKLTGLLPGRYGFHIHELGDTSTCDASGPHFNPDGNNHGGPDHEVRHVGDLGNVVFSSDGTATIDFEGRLISFTGRNSILGRTLVIHQEEDDLGLGNHATSLTTGNAGPRIGCGVIGIKSGTWNSSGTTVPSIVAFGIAAIFNFGI